MNRALKWWLSLGFYLAAVAWFALIGLGLVLVSTPEAGRHSHLIGWAALTIGFVVLVMTMDRWIRYAQVFLGMGIVGGWVIFYRGHLLGSQVPFPRPLAAVMTLALVGCSLIIGTLAKRRLQIIDRVGLVAFVVAFTAALPARRPATALICETVAFGILLALWTYHRFADVDAARRRAS